MRSDRASRTITKCNLLTMYRPLPNNLTIRNSDIDGLGLFATEDIPKGRILGVSHFYWGDQLQRTPLGAFYNHSDKPNIEKVRKDSRYFLITLRDIKEGEELTCTYTFYEV